MLILDNFPAEPRSASFSVLVFFIILNFEYQYGRLHCGTRKNLNATVGREAHTFCCPLDVDIC